MVEGSLWVYGQTRLLDYYEDRLSLRELLNRFYALPAEAPIWDVLRAEDQKAEERRRAAEIDDVLNRYKPRG